MASSTWRTSFSPKPAWSSAAPAAKSQKRRLRRSEEHTSELQSPCNLVCRLLLEKKKTTDFTVTQLLGIDTKGWINLHCSKCHQQVQRLSLNYLYYTTTVLLIYTLVYTSYVHIYY